MCVCVCVCVWWWTNVYCLVVCLRVDQSFGFRCKSCGKAQTPSRHFAKCAAPARMTLMGALARDVKLLSRSTNHETRVMKHETKHGS